jgi:hypothetical protein
VVAVGAAIALLHQGAFHAGSLGNSVAAGTPLQALASAWRSSGTGHRRLDRELIVSVGAAAVVVAGRTLRAVLDLLVCPLRR